MENFCSPTLYMNLSSSKNCALKTDDDPSKRKNTSKSEDLHVVCVVGSITEDAGLGDGVRLGVIVPVPDPEGVMEMLGVTAVHTDVAEVIVPVYPESHVHCVTAVDPTGLDEC
jgi:hypothetical protein